MSGTLISFIALIAVIGALAVGMSFSIKRYNKQMAAMKKKRRRRR